MTSCKQPTAATATTALKIGNNEISSTSPAYIVAELACAHEGDSTFAAGQVQAAARAGASAVKFQIFSADGLVTRDHPSRTMYEKFEFSGDQWHSLAEQARAGGLDVLADVFARDSLEIAERIGCDAVKVHSTNVTNPYFLEEVAGLGKPVLLGVGGTTEAEVDVAVSILRGKGIPVVLVHGFQGYPTQPADENLRRAVMLSKRFGCPIGFAGHADSGARTPIWENLLALALGCVLLEVHITLDRSSQRTDFHSSLLPDDFEHLVEAVRTAESMLGTPDFEFSDAEAAYRASFKSHIVSSAPLAAGHRLEVSDLAFKRVDGGLLPGQAGLLLGRRLRRAIGKDEKITVDSVTDDEEIGR